MCTVSFVSHNETVIITSNRDEKVIRPSAIPPRSYTCNGKNVVYPKDQKAGGTWFVVDANGTVVVLLNGGITKHQVQFSYRRSRGLIALDVICSDSPKDFWSTINLEDIEPFTLVLYQEKKLYELIWDGLTKISRQLDETQNHIWSSVTLYPEEIRKKRSGWFFNFLKEKNEIYPLDMLGFHRNTEDDDSENGLIINRENTLKTLSITQVVIAQNKSVIGYHDLVQAQEFSTAFISI
ncbi:MAG: NRDE family protein [Flavobacterium sp.]